jgi:hypothetical protein
MVRRRALRALTTALAAGLAIATRLSNRIAL